MAYPRCKVSSYHCRSSQDLNCFLKQWATEANDLLFPFLKVEGKPSNAGCLFRVQWWMCLCQHTADTMAIILRRFRLSVSYRTCSNASYPRIGVPMAHAHQVGTNLHCVTQWMISR
jgi:hypothetical protein